MSSLQSYWYRPNKIVWLLLPLSWLFCLIAVIRRKFYQLNILNSHTAEKPLVVVGNIVAGGSGKTPLLIALCDYVQARGYRAGVVSRGYGGCAKGVKQVDMGDSTRVVGDEPLMILQRTGAAVVIGADRVAAMDYLLANNQCDIIFSDDGLQHYRMQRDIEIAVVDGDRKLGNGFCLPAGPLREPASRLQSVDQVVYNATSQEAGKVAENSCYYRLKIENIYRLNGTEQRELSSFSGNRVHAVAGIGHPPRFFQQLSSVGIECIEHGFADHHRYQQQDFSGWSADCIIMTEKDAVKCRQFDLPDAWVVSVSAELSADLTRWLDTELLPVLEKSRD